MAEDVHVWVLGCRDEPRGLRLPRQGEAGVDGRDHEVELLQHLVGIVHLAAVEDVALGPQEDREAFRVPV